MTITTVNLWRLPGAPAQLHAAAATWRDLGERAAGVAEELRGTLAPMGWSGPAAQAFSGRADETTDGLHTVGSVAAGVADDLDHAARVLARGQADLDDEWARLIFHVSATIDGDEVTFTGDELAVRASIATATAVRAQALGGLAAIADQLRARRGALAPVLVVAGRLEEEPLGEGDPVGVLAADDQWVISTGPAGDDISVTLDPATGERLVTVDGVVRRVPAGVELVLRAGAGDDTITVDPAARLRVTILGGAGNDTITGGATVLGLWGDDIISGATLALGGLGDDQLQGTLATSPLTTSPLGSGPLGGDVLDGGSGDDVLYGLDGDDLLLGGEGRDYLDGGAGNDTIIGGWDSDIIFGGRGADTIVPGSGGTDVVRDLPPDVTVQLTQVGGFIRVEGSPDFVARVESDLDALRASPEGVAMLAALQASHDDSAGALFGLGDTLVIRQESGGSWEDSSWRLGQRATVGFNPTQILADAPAPPVVVLFHELSHVYDDFHGLPDSEPDAVGLPGRDPRHPAELTENALRADLGLPPRDHY